MDEEWKLILQDWDGEDPELYNLEADPEELVNLGVSQPPVAGQGRGAW